MKNFIPTLAAILVLFLFNMSQAHAFFTPVSVAIVPPVQFPPQEFSVTGPRVSLIYGDVRDVYGIDIGGIGNITRQSFVGLAASGIFNMTHGATTILGLQFAGAFNLNTEKSHVYGIQLAGGVNENTAESSVTGIQAALLANMSEHTNIYGVQLGLYNCAQNVYGFQIGLVNVANSLHGFQIGLANFHKTGLFAVSPILNFGF